jgi:hypothetical protein
MEFGDNLKPKPNIGYHRGDLGKSEYQGRMTSGRSTGHYGTGTYFLGKPTNEYPDRPEHKVDFSKYNLYKPKTSEQGYNLHDSLKVINNYRYDEERLQDALTNLADIFGVDYEQMQKMYKEQVLSKEINELKPEQITDRSIDTLSTVLMKALGYQGIDVRHLEELDNLGYGSVIYDLLKSEGE